MRNDERCESESAPLVARERNESDRKGGARHKRGHFTGPAGHVRTATHFECSQAGGWDVVLKRLEHRLISRRTGQLANEGDFSPVPDGCSVRIGLKPGVQTHKPIVKPHAEIAAGQRRQQGQRHVSSARGTPQSEKAAAIGIAVCGTTTRPSVSNSGRARRAW
eukprot:scaffold32864_cov28-Tisochrysis_lutea.AAC.4